MTIALGLLTSRQIIFAADSQEGDGITKMDVGKISLHANLFRDKKNNIGSRGVFVTGAGDSGYLKYLSEEINHDFRRDEPSIEDFESYLKNQIQDFHAVHVPLSPQGTSIELIVSAQSKGKRAMWVTHLSTVRRVTSYAVVGSGNTWARKVLDGFIPALVDEHAATVIAAHAVFTAKQHAEGCGMDTYICCLHQTGQLRIAKQEALRDLEDLFREYEHREKMARLAVMGMQSIQTHAGLIDIESFFSTVGQKIAKLDFYGPLLSIPAVSPRPQSTKGAKSPRRPSREKP